MILKLKRPWLLLLNPLYWLGTKINQMLFDLGLKKSTTFALPIIAVGNLSTGGTGKTPHTEYLISLLKNRFKIAVLSRGYRRKTTGFQWAEKGDDAKKIGDEPAQMKSSFPDVMMAVDANRVHGVRQLLAAQHPPEIILLDDAFQHRKIQAGFYILLTPLHHLYVDDWVLPAGNLRETRSGADRAHAIVVTKCPPNLSAEKREQIKNRLQPKAFQQVFFSTIKYQEPENAAGEFDIAKPFVLLTGIADAAPLVAHLESEKRHFEHLHFADHHHFTETELLDIVKSAKTRGQILTTEKDAQRLPISLFEKHGIALAFLPISIDFLEDKNQFDELIFTYVKGMQSGAES